MSSRRPMPTDGYRVGPSPTPCPKCGEDRLVSLVQDRRGVRFVCDVCSAVWVEPPKRDVSGVEITGP